jgi:non-specific serine/threonine protein kinase
MIGQTISHYKILEKLGGGGMGVVYKAEDTKLHRTVALKFLPPELTRDEEAKKRFIHEAQAASSLDHNNICSIHQVDETDDGQIFICMNYYDGETLKKKIERCPIRLDEAIDIAIQIANGLQKAHEKGIIHRDIKPANIFITNDGIVKILDFGLAKLSGQTIISKTGSTVGTAAYMSPEQARGEIVDQRTDIWSLGVVLYEMLTGELPFRSEYEQAMIYSILNEQPKTIDLILKDFPKQLIHITEKSLEKNPELRYKNMSEVVKELEYIKTGSFYAKKEKSILVLPFEDMSPGKDNEYFSDGLTEELITDLSGVHDLLVISRSSAMTFKGTKKTIPEIARQLNVQYILEGSVRKAGNSLRITAQLIDAQNDMHLWAEKYDGLLDDVFGIQEKVSRSIVAALKLKLTPEESQKILERPIDNVAAYQCYLKANAECWRFNENSLKSALNHLQKGIDILGDNALLYSAMAFVYWQFVNMGFAHKDFIMRAEEYATKALILDPESPQAHFVVAMINGWVHGNVRDYIRGLKTALTLNPNYVDALILLAGLATMSVGKISVAIPFVQRVKQIDPLGSWNYWLQGRLYFFNGQYELAVEQFRQNHQLDPDNLIVRFFYALTLTYTKKLDEAFSIINHCKQVAPDNVVTKFGLLLKYGLLKNREKVFLEMTPDFERTCRRDHQWSYLVAVPLVLVDAREKSLYWLENAVERGFINYPELERNSYLDNIRNEKRFTKLMERVKKEWEAFEM